MRFDELTRSLNSIVVSLQAELDEALQQKASIKLRMRNLRRHLGMLQARAHNKSKPRGKSPKPQNVDTHAQAREMCRLQEKLWRACRIAFLEFGGTATSEELYSAIMRRGSFPFTASGNDGVAEIVRTLTSLARSGEVVCNTNSSQRKWTYKGSGHFQ
jgi:regulator of replication initiation timing